jgi:hypothetical protein
MAIGVDGNSISEKSFLEKLVRHRRDITRERNGVKI